MPDVRARVIVPNGAGAASGRTRVRYRLVDMAGNRVTQAYDSEDRLIVDEVDVDVDVEGDYQISLPPSTQITPSGTRWQRIIVLRGAEGPSRTVIMPVGGGPYNEVDILETVMDPLPEPVPANLLDEAEFSTPTGNLAVDAFTMKLVSNTTVTVPDIATPVMLEGAGPLKHSAANANVALGIIAVGGTIGTWIDIKFGVTLGIGTLAGPTPKAKLPAHSPGDYQLCVYSFTAGNIVVDAGTPAKCSLRVFSA